MWSYSEVDSTDDSRSVRETDTQGQQVIDVSEVSTINRVIISIISTYLRELVDASWHSDSACQCVLYKGYM